MILARGHEHPNTIGRARAAGASDGQDRSRGASAEARSTSIGSTHAALLLPSGSGWFRASRTTSTAALSTKSGIEVVFAEPGRRSGLRDFGYDDLRVVAVARRNRARPFDRVGKRESRRRVRGPDRCRTRPDQFHYRGVRVFDDYEREQVALLNLDIQPIDGPAPNGDLFLHIDLDVLDPTSFPFTTWPTDDGPTIAQLASAVEHLVDAGRVVGVAVTECAAPTPEDAQALEPILAVLRRWHARTTRSDV